MVNETELNLIFHALSDPTRRAMLEEIARGNPSVGDLARPFAMSAPAISKHLKVLERAKLVTRVKEGTVSRFELDRGLLEEAEAWVSRLAEFEKSSAPLFESVVESGELEDHLI